MGKGYKRDQKFMSGYRPVVRAREGRMLGIRQPLDGPVFDTLEDAENWCIHAMISHYERKLGMAGARFIHSRIWSIALLSRRRLATKGRYREDQSVQRSILR